MGNEPISGDTLLNVHEVILSTQELSGVILDNSGMHGPSLENSYTSPHIKVPS